MLQKHISVFMFKQQRKS